MTDGAKLTVTRDQVMAALEAGRDWAAAARGLSISPGLAFMIATGIPADGAGVPPLPTVSAAVTNPSSPQSLLNERGHNPRRDDRVDAWVRTRAARDLSR